MLIIANNPLPCGCHKDEVIRMIHLVYEKPMYMSKERRPLDNWVPMMKAWCRVRCSYNADKILKYLVKVNVLESDNNYIVTKKSIWYRFNIDYMVTPKPIKVFKHTIIKKIRTNTVRKGRTYHLQHLSKFFNSNLGFECKKKAKRKLKEFISSTFDNNQVLLAEKRHFAHASYQYGELGILQISNQQFLFKEDDFSGRLHTSLTSLPSILRGELRYENEPLVSCDITNCQPLIMSNLYLPRLFETQYLMKEKLKTRRREEIIEKDIIMMMKIMQDSDSKEYKNYKSLVENGRFYEMIMDLTGLDRSSVKKGVMQALFSSNRYGCKIKTKLKDAFPQLMKQVYIMKSGDKNLLPMVLQSIEVNLMLHRVTIRIAKERPNLPIFTIHDCCMTTIGNEHYVQRVIKEEAEKFLNVSPQVKLEYYGNESRK